MKSPIPIHQLKKQAKRLAREERIPLHAALDRIAQARGFAAWSLLAARSATISPAQALLPRLSDAELVILGARPGHGKTLLGLQLLLDAARLGRQAVFFTLEYTEREASERIDSLCGIGDGYGDRLDIVTSDEISADFIIQHLHGCTRGTLAVIDYLQILDQRRSKPTLADQIAALRNFARSSGVILVFIAQIDRSFTSDDAAMPSIKDIRLPNPVDLSAFAKAIFLHDGRVRFEAVA